MSEKWSAKGKFQQFTDLILQIHFIYYPDFILRCKADMVLVGCILYSLWAVNKCRKMKGDLTINTFPFFKILWS